MSDLGMQSRLSILASALLLSTAAAAQTHIPATGLCNTGLTPAGLLLRDCATTTLVTPLNPESGGPSVDGNWELATPYPSAPYNQPAPNPCSLTTFAPAWVDAPWPGWFNPDDGLSQWITPLVEGPVAAGGWYIYRTIFPIPPIVSGYDEYALTVTGQLLADNTAAAIVLSNASGHQVCRTMAILSGSSQFIAWNPFTFAATVLPNHPAYLYFVVYNYEQSNGNPTGLRVEFTSAYFTPE